jgi:23S rRNA (uridine2552-2'-O)-methyltransferase
MGKGYGPERKRDYFYRRAKELKLRSRAAFKLKQLDDRYHLLRRGDVVIDLGAAPGGWLQVAHERVGEEGFVLGVDIQPIEKLPHPNVKTVVADITDPSTSDLIRRNIPRPADVLLSDASPRISGVWDVDHSRSVELAAAALSIAEGVLRRGGMMVVKVFQGKLFWEFLKKVEGKFEFVKASKPFASRKASAESYIIAKGFRRP